LNDNVQKSPRRLGRRGGWTPVSVRGNPTRLFFDRFPQAMWIFDRRTLAILSVNQAAVALYGYSREEFLGRTLNDLYTQEERPALLHDLSTLYGEPDGWAPSPRTCRRLRRKDGAILDVEVIWTPFLDRGREEILAVFQDVTQQRRTEERLRFQEAIVSQVHDAIFAVDNRRRIIYWNRAAERQYGLPANEALGHPLTDIVSCRWLLPENESTVIDSLSRAGAWHGHETHRRRDGEPIRVESSVTVLRDDCGDRIGLLAVVRDVTERARAEARLRDSQRQLLEAEKLGHIGAWEWDVATGAQIWSEELYRIFGIEPGRIPATFEGFMSLVEPEDRPAVRATTEKALRDHQPFSREFTIRRPGGVIRTVLACGEVLVDASRRPVRLVGATLDITDRKRAEAERARFLDHERSARGAAEEAAAQLEVLSRRLVELQEAERRNLARELHDEMGQLLTGLRLLLLTDRPGIPERPRDRLAGDTRGKMMSIISELMQRIRTLSMDLRPAMLDDLGLLPALRWHFKRYGDQTGVRVKFAQAGLDGRLEPALEIAAFRIVQEALTNVARHAGVAAASVELRKGDDRLLIRIEDRGPGFDVESALRGPSSGLAGMRERARLMGGSLSIESQTGGSGTRLTAELPLAPASGIMPRK